MMLITNIILKDKRLSLAILKVYLKRWRIEEYFRFKKQQFNFEDIRVRSISSIKTMSLILSLTIGFIAMLSEKRKESLLVLCIVKISKRTYDIPNFGCYALADGIYAVLQKTRTGIKNFIKSKLKKENHIS